ncbi:MAG: thiamine-phosphate kinase [Planctomycetota bacterium]|nr:MAG: thiamine-phosphate kinase [Planctomycetota bacterium]
MNVPSGSGMNEDGLIAHVRGRVATDPAPDIGIGDDACVWTPGGPTCLSVDGIVEGRHFTKDDPPQAVGRKAAAAALSDLAAMGARPVGAVVSLHCPSRWSAVEVMDGVLAELQRHGCHCYGGDTTAAEQLTISVTVWGESVPDGRFLARSSAEPGDLLVLTGQVGGSLRKGRHLSPQPRLAEGQWFAMQMASKAMMDCSDGLAADAAKMAAASGCGCLLLPGNVPRHDDVDEAADVYTQALCDGEDYELLVAVDAAAWPALQLAWPFDLPLTTVGWLIEQPGNFIEDHLGRVIPSPFQGFSHGL